MVKFDTIHEYDMEKAEIRAYRSPWQTRDFAAFPGSLFFHFHRVDFSSIMKARILKPLKSYSSGLIETRVIPKWLSDSMCSSIDLCKHRIKQVKFASLKRKSELGELEILLKLDKLVNFSDEVDINRQWVGLELHYKQPDFVGNLSRTNLVKLLPLFCGFMQKGHLENHLFTKNAAIEPESCNKRHKIEVGVDGRLAFHHVSEEQYMYKDIKLYNILIHLKVSDMLPDRTTKGTSRWSNYALNVDGFTSLNIPSVSQQRAKASMEIEKTEVCTGAPTTKNSVEMASEWRRNRSYVHETWPMKVKNESQSNVHHILLLIFTLLATITFHTALKFYLPRCRLQEGYETNSSLDSMIQNENQSSYSTRILIMFNSVAFFVSAGMMMVLFNELPFRPWLLVLVFSMIGSYMCILMDPMNPSLCPS